MSPETFEVREFETDEQAKAAGFTVSLTKEQAGELAGMNRKQRRAWLAQHRNEGGK